MNVGFIGVGSMGSTLVKAFVNSGTLEPGQVTLHNRTFHKAQTLASRYPGMRASTSMIETAVQNDILFLCVKPLEFHSVLDTIGPFVRAEQIVVSITSPVLIDHLERCIPCKIAKIIPSITNYNGGGATLCMYGSRVNDEDKSVLESLLSRISTPIQIQERHARAMSDISSIGPAFLSFYVRQLVDAAVQVAGIDREEAERLAAEMVYGTGKLLVSEQFTLSSLEARVAVPGGITEEALKLLDREMSGLFDSVIRTTHAKYEEDVAKVEQSLFGEQSFNQRQY